MNRTVGHYHFIDLAYVDDAAILTSDQLQADRQCPPINAFGDIVDFKLSWPKTKLQNVGADDPPPTILIDGVPVEGVENGNSKSRRQNSCAYIDHTSPRGRGNGKGTSRGVSRCARIWSQILMSNISETISRKPINTVLFTY